ncbi:MAG: VanZ family protein [Bacillota bacterium]|jgi:VanZ family protein
MKKKNIIILLNFLFLLWIVMIFYFSSQPPSVSNSQSGLVVKIIRTVNNIFDITDTKLFIKIESLLKDIWPFNKYKTPNAVVRKSAHFGIYFLLGMISSSFGYIYSKKTLIGILLGISLPVMIAVLDEFNQGFVGRTSSLNDVIIDGAGALTGTFVIMFSILIIRIIKLLRRYFLKK